jgi:hypothetical protein
LGTDDPSARDLGAQRHHDGAEIPCCQVLQRDAAAQRTAGTQGRLPPRLSETASRRRRLPGDAVVKLEVELRLGLGLAEERGPSPVSTWQEPASRRVCRRGQSAAPVTKATTLATSAMGCIAAVLVRKADGRCGSAAVSQVGVIFPQFRVLSGASRLLRCGNWEKSEQSRGG